MPRSIVIGARLRKPIPFEVYPLSLYELQHVTETDWARKEIAGAAIYREWVGENDEELHFRGKVFPHFFARFDRQKGFRPSNAPLGWGGADWHPGRGWAISEGGRAGGSTGGSSGGMGHLDVLDNMRRGGQSHQLMRGDGANLGWFVIQRLMRAHEHLERDGIGQMISFEITFQRVPVPINSLEYWGKTWQAVGPS